MNQLADKFPMTGRAWQELDDETVADIDQLLFRYIKLQDAMGQRLFPALLQISGDWREDESFIDKLNRLEKLRAIPAADRWLESRSTRNRMTHEYPDAPEKNAANVNAVIESTRFLKESLAQAHQYAEKLTKRLGMSIHPISP